MKNAYISFDKKIFLIIFITFLFTADYFCQDHREWSYNLNIYEVNTRNYTVSGTFNEFKINHLDRLKEMGVGIIWFMPINPIGSKNRLGTLGSPYSVKDYLSVNPEYGTLEDFKSLVNEIHLKGMYVIIDWVANHTSWDNVLTTTHPEWYVKNSSGNFMAPAGTNWTDVIQLDYSKRELRDYMIQVMSFWVKDIGVDGFRCDAVSFMPGDFWSEAIVKLKEINPKLFMLAEDDKYVYQYLGFNMSYAWGMYGFGSGVLKRIAGGTNNANDLDHYLHTETISYDQHYRMYFTSNHDENSWYGTDTELFGNYAEPFAVLTGTVNGMQLVYGGEESGLNKRLAFFEKDKITWQEHPLANIYTTLNKLKKANSALWNGLTENSYRRVKTSNDDKIFSFVRRNGKDKIFAVFNLSAQSFLIDVNDSSAYGEYEDVFAKIKVKYNSPFSLSLSPYGYRIFKKVDPSTKIEEENSLSSGFTLLQNYPNPFNPVTTIRYSVPHKQFISLRVHDVLGKEVALLINQESEPGEFEVKFNASEFPSGVYFYQLRAGDFVETKKLLFLK